MVLIPIRPTALKSPSLAMPTTSVQNTSGPTIILIKRKNILEITCTLLAISWLTSGDKVRNKYSPRASPKTNPMIIFCVKLNFIVMRVDVGIFYKGVFGRQSFPKLKEIISNLKV